MVLQRKVQKFVDRKQLYEDNNKNDYVLIMGQCTKSLRVRLESRKDCKSLNNDPIEPLKYIKETNHIYHDGKYAIE